MPNQLVELLRRRARRWRENNKREELSRLWSRAFRFSILAVSILSHFSDSPTRLGPDERPRLRVLEMEAVLSCL